MHVTCVVIEVYIVMYRCGAEHSCVYGGVLLPSLLLYLFSHSVCACVCVCAFSPEPPPVCYCCISFSISVCTLYVYLCRALVCVWRGFVSLLIVVSLLT